MAKKAKDQGAARSLNEVFGIALIGSGLLVAFFLWSGAAGIVGDYAVLILKYALGAGRVLVPLCLAAWGLAYLMNKPRPEIESVGIGLLLAAASLMATLHLFALGQAGLPPTRAFRPDLIVAYGGVIGALLAFVFGSLLRAGAYIVFLVGLLIGLMLSTGLSVSQLLSRAWESVRARRNARRESQAERSRAISRAPTLEQPYPVVAEEERAQAGRHELLIPAETGPPRKSSQLKIPVVDSPDGSYQLPPSSIFKRTAPRASHSKKNVKENIAILEKVLREFDVDASVDRVVRGPTVTRFEIQLGTGVKVNRVLALADDLALALATADVRILAPIPGRSAIGIEIPNEQREPVTLGDILTTSEIAAAASPLTIAIGKDIAGQPVLADLGQMPHLLIAGATGSGKSVCINSLLACLLARTRPDEVKMILIDPKRIELNLFKDIPHLLTPVVTGPKEAATVLAWAVAEMERRFDQLAELGVRNIDSFNATIRRDDPEREAMPYVVLVIDELADLMMVSANEVEDAICRIAQLARAVGIHLVVATQRPSVDIITGLIKSNITVRIAFAVSSSIDSRVILDTPGAEKLVGKGDLLFSTPGLSHPRRIQGAMITEAELEMLTGFCKAQGTPEYRADVLESKKSKHGYDFEDEMLDEAMELVVECGMASASMLQRRLRLGYARAARLIDMLEQKGVVGPHEGSKPRAVLITPDELERVRSEAGAS